MNDIGKIGRFVFYNEIIIVRVEKFGYLVKVFLFVIFSKFCV